MTRWSTIRFFPLVAASEKIVPSGHSSHKNPEGVAELVRIVHLHLDDL
jgi:hypothetical protein